MKKNKKYTLTEAKSRVETIWHHNPPKNATIATITKLLFTVLCFLIIGLLYNPFSDNSNQRH